VQKWIVLHPTLMFLIRFYASSCDPPNVHCSCGGLCRCPFLYVAPSLLFEEGKFSFPLSRHRSVRVPGLLITPRPHFGSRDPCSFSAHLASMQLFPDAMVIFFSPELNSQHLQPDNQHMSPYLRFCLPDTGWSGRFKPPTPHRLVLVGS